jgi:hypothetical protein
MNFFNPLSLLGLVTGSGDLVYIAWLMDGIFLKLWGLRDLRDAYTLDI